SGGGSSYTGRCAGSGKRAWAVSSTWSTTSSTRFSWSSSKPASSAAGASRRLAERSAAVAFQEILKPALDLLSPGLVDDRRRIDAHRRRRGVPRHLRPDLAASMIDSQIEVHATGRKAVVSRDPDLE